MTVPILRYRIVPSGETLRSRIVSTDTLLRGRVLPSVPALQVALRVSGGWIQWRVGESGAWTNLIETVDLAPSAAEILALLLTVDGAGSLLDADLLDGVTGADYLARANHTGTQTAATISDFDTEVGNHADVAANTAARHDAVTVTDSTEINFTLTGQDITAALIAGSVDETKLDASVNASLDLADSALQAAAIGVSVQAWDAQLDSLSAASANGVSLVTAANYAAMRALLDLEAGTDFLSPAAIAAAYQPLDADLTSWAGVTRAAGLDTFVATPSSANLAALVTDETGTGALVFATSPTLVTPALGTPSALVLTNATGLTTAGVAAATLVTAADTIAANNNDTTIPTSAAVKAYADSVGGGGGSLGVTPVGGTADDGTAFAAALTAADGGLITLEPATTYTLKGTGFDFPASGVIIEGNGATVLIDPPAYVQNYFRATGTLATAVALASNALQDDTSITLTDASSFAAGDFVVVRDEQFAGKTPTRILAIQAVDTGTDVIDFVEPVGIGLLTASSADVQKWTPVGDIAIHNVHFVCASGSDIDRLFYFYAVNGISFTNCTVNGHAALTNPASQNTVRCEYCRDIDISHNSFISTVDGSSEGNAVASVWCEKPTTSENYIENYAFGIGDFFGYLPNQTSNRASTFRNVGGTGSGRAFKASGCAGPVVSHNQASGFATGIKVEDCTQWTVHGNVLRFIGEDTGDAAINLSSQQALTAPYGRNNVCIGNTVRDCSGTGIQIDQYADNFIIALNIIENVGRYGILAGASSVGSILDNIISLHNQAALGDPAISAPATVALRHLDITNGHFLLGTDSHSATPARLKVKKAHAAGTSQIETETDSTSASNHLLVRNPNGLVGSIQSNASATAYNTSSDARLKEHLSYMPSDVAMDIIRRIDIHEFKWKVDGQKDFGAFAQELLAIWPLAVSVGFGEPGDKNFMPWSVDYSKLVIPMIAAFKGLDARVSALEA